MPVPSKHGGEPFAFAETLAFHFEDFPFDSHIRLVVPDLANADKIAFVDISEGKVGEQIPVGEDMGFLPQRLGFGRAYALEVFYVLAEKIEHPVIRKAVQPQTLALLTVRRTGLEPEAFDITHSILVNPQVVLYFKQHFLDSIRFAQLRLDIGIEILDGLVL